MPEIGVIEAGTASGASGIPAELISRWRIAAIGIGVAGAGPEAAGGCGIGVDGVETAAIRRS
jgi:hypothetical protein